MYRWKKHSIPVLLLGIRDSIARLREMVHRGEIKVFWVDGKRQIADAMTKRGASSEKLLQVLNSCNLPWEDC